MSNRLTAKVRWFNEEKGFGFVTDDVNGEDLFLHKSQLNGVPVSKNDPVEYCRSEGTKGPRAVNVRVLRSSTTRVS